MVYDSTVESTKGGDGASEKVLAENLQLSQPGGEEMEGAC